MNKKTSHFPLHASCTTSVVIPCKYLTDCLRKETIPALINQSYQNFEIIIVTDKSSEEKFPKTKIIPSWPKIGPADKKDLGVKNAKGEFIAFIDDDVYPDKHWLENALSNFLLPPSYFPPLTSHLPLPAAVCGPGLTPPNDPLLAKVSGWMWASPLGSGGAGQYRNWPMKEREIDDYPTFNLIVKKKDILKAGGFDSRFWPGEDTEFCHKLVYKLKKKIIYHPDVIVYHHRRKIFKDHLKQIGRYGIHRGYFAKILPKTSRKIGYFLPMLFSLGVILTPLIIFTLEILNLCFLSLPLFLFYILLLTSYFLLLFFNAVWIFSKSKSLLIAFLSIPTIFVSHLFYGLMFIKGLLKKDLISKYGREKL